MLLGRDFVAMVMSCVSLLKSDTGAGRSRGKPRSAPRQSSSWPRHPIDDAAVTSGAAILARFWREPARACARRSYGTDWLPRPPICNGLSLALGMAYSSGMDVGTFLVRLVEALAWPIVVLFAFWNVREHLGAYSHEFVSSNTKIPNSTSTKRSTGLKKRARRQSRRRSRRQ